MPGMTAAVHCCSDPFNLLLSVAGITFVGWTLFDYHTTLRFIAIIGLFTTAVSVVSGYESAEVGLVSSQAAPGNLPLLQEVCLASPTR